MFRRHEIWNGNNAASRRNEHLLFGCEKNGAKIYQIDYDEEESCEKMIEAHKFIQESHREGSPEPYAGLLRVSLSSAKEIVFFDPKTGAADWGVRFKREQND